MRTFENGKGQAVNVSFLSIFENQCFTSRHHVSRVTISLFLLIYCFRPMRRFRTTTTQFYCSFQVFFHSKNRYVSAATVAIVCFCSYASMQKRENIEINRRRRSRNIVVYKYRLVPNGSRCRCFGTESKTTIALYPRVIV